MATKKTPKTAASGITATSQTSRFHVDVITTLSQELDLKQVTVAVGDVELLQDAHLRIKAGVRYGLIGRNGEGKSTLLKAMSEKIIPGIPENMRILLVSQVDGTDPSIGGEPGKVASVLQRVVSSDKRREMAMREQRILSHALEATEMDVITAALTSIRLERTQRDLVEAQKTANKRSGARGAEARKQLLKAEAEVAEAEKRVNDPSELDAGKTLMSATAMLEEVQDILDTLDAASTEARARTILLGLGFTLEMIDGSFSSLSGGWRSRASLASALIQQIDILLLDECTNYLDLDAVIWLSHYLSSLQCSMVLVAHDRDFLDNVSDETIILKDRQLKYFEGSLTNYERDLKKKRKYLRRMQDGLDKRKDAIEKSIRDGHRRAKESNDDALHRQVKSRKKKLDERWGLERNAKGHKFKLNRDLEGYHFTNREEVEIEELEREVSFPLIDPDLLRFPGVLFSATGVAFRYSSRTPYVLQNVDIKVHPGSRVGLVGRNGEGKSTLVKLLTGKLKPTVGTIECHPRLRFGHYDQHSVEAFSAPEFASISAVQHFIETMKRDHDRNIEEATARSYLGSYGLQGRKATCPVLALSGGQRVRLALALVTYAAPDALVLDEVTTHLDLYANSALVRALKAYTGAVVVVSHDRHLIRCVVEGAPVLPPSELPDDDESDEDKSDEECTAEPGNVYIVGKSQVKLAAGVDTYTALVEKRVKRAIAKTQA
ncbi:P-loop containing nucleoside triphosphate hydrolase protein [Auriculariales sp. MPI-PUGE-AT-0066]|nr:P-loop containing nucleoside triphosphate hydrolase protein [Auriculariales sp. MPI-PUGE-AT-0066]